MLLTKAYRIFRNTFFLREPVVGSAPIVLMGVRRFLLFMLHLAVPYWYVAKFILLRAHRKNSKHLVCMIESGVFHPALRLITPEERFAIRRAYDGMKGQLQEPVSEEFALTQGYKRLGSLVSPQDCESVVHWLKNEKGYLGQVPTQSNGELYSYDEAMKLSAQQGRYFSFAPGTSLKNPFIAGLANHPLVMDMVRASLGGNAALYSVNTFIVFPGEKIDHYVMKVHRDYDDFNFIAFFIYWTPVDAQNGATMFMPGTHMRSDKALEQNKVFLEGNPGDVFALDTFGYHSGNSAVKTPRFVTWVRFGLENNLAVADGWPLAQVQRLMQRKN